MQHEALKQTAESIKYACRPAAIKALVQVCATTADNISFPCHTPATILSFLMSHSPHPTDPALISATSQASIQAVVQAVQRLATSVHTEPRSPADFLGSISIQEVTDELPEPVSAGAQHVTKIEMLEAQLKELQAMLQAQMANSQQPPLQQVPATPAPATPLVTITEGSPATTVASPEASAPAPRRTSAGIVRPDMVQVLASSKAMKLRRVSPSKTAPAANATAGPAASMESALLAALQRRNMAFNSPGSVSSASSFSSTSPVNTPEGGSAGRAGPAVKVCRSIRRSLERASTTAAATSIAIQGAAPAAGPPRKALPAGLAAGISGFQRGALKKTPREDEDENAGSPAPAATCAPTRARAAAPAASGRPSFLADIVNIGQKGLRSVKADAATKPASPMPAAAASAAPAGLPDLASALGAVQLRKTGRALA